MKKLFVCLLACVLVLCLAACGGNNAGGDTNAGDTNTNTTTENNQKPTNQALTVEAVKNAPVTSEVLFEVEDVDGGVAITNFTGDDEIVVIPETIGGKTVVAIGKEAFMNNEKILALRLANTVHTIGNMAFANCRKMKIFISGNGLKIIEARGFGNCKSLESVELNEGLLEIKELAFSLVPLKNLSVPDSVEVFEMPFTKSFGEPLKLIAKSGGAVEQYVNEFGEEENVVFQAK